MAYYDGKPCVNMNELNALLQNFIELGVTIGVISWCSKGGSYNYNSRTRAVKKLWLRENLPCVSEIHIVKYGTPKQKIAHLQNSVLVDDNIQVRKEWQGKTIDAREDILEQLNNLLLEITCKK